MAFNLSVLWNKIFESVHRHFLKIIFVFFIFRSDVESLQFQMTIEIPRIKVKAQYRSSGILILVRASGAGDYWGEYREYYFYLHHHHHASY